MDVQSIILGFLMRKSMTGYELKKYFSLSFSYFSGLSYGSIYPALKKMVKANLITMHLVVQDGSPNRKVYTITDAGRTAFIESLKTPLEADRHKNAFLTRLFFFAHLSPEERRTIAIQYLQSVQEISNQLEAARPQVEAVADRFQYLCFEFGLRSFRDLAKNIAEIIRAMEET